MEPLPPPKNRPSQFSELRSQVQSGNQARDYTSRSTGTENLPPSSFPTIDHEMNSNSNNNNNNTVGPPPPTRPQGPQATDTSTTVKAKKRRHRGGKKRKNRRQSFAAPSEAETATSAAEVLPIDPLLEGETTSPPRFYRQRTNRSDDSLDSDHLLDHRDQPMSLRPRRESRVTPGIHNASHRGQMFFSGIMGRRGSGEQARRHTMSRDRRSDRDESDNGPEPSDRTPLIGNESTHRSPRQTTGFGGLFQSKSRSSSKSSGRKRQTQALGQSNQSFEQQEYDINNPPSVPNSPDMRPQYNQRNTPDTGFLARSPDSRRNLTKDALIDIDQDNDHSDDRRNSVPGSPEFRPGTMTRHQTISLPVEGDVCFPAETMSEMGGYENEDFERTPSAVNGHKRRSRRRQWPQLWALDEWSHQEKEHRAGQSRVKKTNEPVFIEGRLRPSKNAWHRQDEDAPYRYTYFNDDFESTIHAQSISELGQSGGSFRELFIPDPPLLSDSSDSEEEEEVESDDKNLLSPRSQINMTRDSSNMHSRIDSILTEKSKSDSRAPSVRGSAGNSGDHTPLKTKKEKPKKYGPQPTFWLDVQSPTEQEMRVLCKTFGIHALTSEDIMMQEAREKVELFRHYYFINYRTFEQDTNSEDYLEPINMYVVVFRQGILTFHFSQIPHPANVRRRIRQLTDYLILSSDWISYAIIDDITDVYQPLIHNIEAEVDDIDELILRAFNETDELKGLVDVDKKVAEKKAAEKKASEKKAGDKKAGDTKGPNEPDTDEDTKRVSGIDMLRRIGECRKKVMSLYRLLGNKADVIKGFAKRCNEQWEVAPKTEIGLYLGDIQDHILTMTSNLSHYETLLSRAHSNYLAQVSIRMNERQEQTSDVLGKLTVVGTIVLPMNIICGMWGMNVKVPGQEIDNLNWFAAITAGLILFALICYFFCKRVYGIV